eukprot:Sspe_Gene.73391::Locus_44259_Transcript_1_1_Confidence_1.000_Length_563::g.73391::m.73391
MARGTTAEGCSDPLVGLECPLLPQCHLKVAVGYKQSKKRQHQQQETHKQRAIFHPQGVLHIWGGEGHKWVGLAGMEVGRQEEVRQTYLPAGPQGRTAFPTAKH